MIAVATAADVRYVLRQFGLLPSAGEIESLGSAGGFSGARFWRILQSDAFWCLRRWPAEHPAPDVLAHIHAVLWYVAEHGFSLVPLPRRVVTASDSHGAKTFVSHAGHLWELTPWLPGKADYRASPNPAKLQSAMQALARFHKAAETMPGIEPRQGPSPGLAHRQTLLGRWMAGDIRRLEAVIEPALWPELAELANRLLAAFPSGATKLATQLPQIAHFEVPLQPCIRDIWHAHVLFQGDRVSGLVDFGSLQTDHVACDVARLLGSLAGDDQDHWVQGLQAYQALRPLSEHELSLVRTFDMSNVILSGMNWLEWVFIEHRTFDDRPAVVQRVAEILGRLEHLTAG